MFLCVVLRQLLVLSFFFKQILCHNRLKLSDYRSVMIAVVLLSIFVLHVSYSADMHTHLHMLLVNTQGF